MQPPSTTEAVQPTIQHASTTESVVTATPQRGGFQAYPSTPRSQEAYPSPSYPYPPQGPANEMTAYPNQNVYI